MEEKPSYYSILTADVRYNKNLSASEKLFYSELTALSGAGGYCYASNKYFTLLFECSSRTITNWLHHLMKENLIAVTHVNFQRRIFIKNVMSFNKNNTKKKKTNKAFRTPSKYEIENRQKNIMDGMDIL